MPVPVPEAWSEQELLELGQLSSAGVPIEHVAKFLERDLDDVRAHAAAIRLAVVLPAEMGVRPERR